jgi:glycine/D-amino acid oxidase-like deaminating enzyme
MPATADVIIIGGGIVGASIARHLTSAGCRNVIILDRPLGRDFHEAPIVADLLGDFIG